MAKFTALLVAFAAASAANAFYLVTVPNNMGADATTFCTTFNTDCTDYATSVGTEQITNDCRLDPRGSGRQRTYCQLVDGSDATDIILTQNGVPHDAD